MSRVTLLLVAVALVGFVAGAPAPLEQSDLEKFENMDLSSILSNKRLRTAYVNCMVDKGPCTADAAEFKKILPDLTETQCADCSAKFKELIKKSVTTFQKDYPEDWKTLMAHFDPDNKRAADLEKFMSS
ncbi:ejaculatory bulb-specific protein 3 [Bemisia tabaci]